MTEDELCMLPAEDVTDLTRAEEIRLWYAAIVESSDDAIIAKTLDGVVSATPLRSRSGRFLGMLSTHWRTPHDPTEVDFRFFDVLARQAADLIEAPSPNRPCARASNVSASSRIPLRS